MATPMQHDGLVLNAKSTLGDRATEAFVLSAMALTTITVGTALYTHVPLDIWLSVILALALYVGFLVFHGFMRRRTWAQTSHIQDRQSDREKGGQVAPVAQAPFREMINSPVPPSTGPSAVGSPAPAVGTEPMRLPVDGETQESSRAPNLPLPGGSAPIGGGTSPHASGTSFGSEGQTGVTARAGQVSPPEFDGHNRIAPLQKDGVGVGGGSALEPDVGSVNDAVGKAAGSAAQVSPTPPQAPFVAQGSADGFTAEESEPGTREDQAVSPRDSDVEMIQGLIKKLADQVNEAEQNDLTQGTALVSRTAIEGGPPGALTPESDATQSSVDALNAAAGSMRSFDTATETPAVSGFDETPASATDSAFSHDEIDPHGSLGNSNGIIMAERLAELSEALHAKRFDVLLDPIIGLSDFRARHFEVRLQFRDSAKNVLSVDELESGLSGTGLYPMIDAACLARVEKISARLEERGRGGNLFTRIAGESLANTAFVSDVHSAAVLRDELVGRLIMTVTQAHVRRFGAQEWATLRDLRKLGFRFAISGVCDLDMDFEGLVAKGFSFARLDAEVFLNGLPTGEHRIPARDIGRYLATLGMTLIVGKIDNESIATKVNDYGVVFGQGLHFGAPRTVKPEVFAGVRDGNAAA